MAEKTPPQVFNVVEGSWLESPSSMLAVLGDQFACKSEFIYLLAKEAFETSILYNLMSFMQPWALLLRLLCRGPCWQVAMPRKVGTL